MTSNLIARPVSKKAREISNNETLLAKRADRFSDVRLHDKKYKKLRFADQSAKYKKNAGNFKKQYTKECKKHNEIVGTQVD